MRNVAHFFQRFFQGLFGSLLGFLPEFLARNVCSGKNWISCCRGPWHTFVCSLLSIWERSQDCARWSSGNDWQYPYYWWDLGYVNEDFETNRSRRRSLRWQFRKSIFMHSRRALNCWLLPPWSMHQRRWTCWAVMSVMASDKKASTSKYLDCFQSIAVSRRTNCQRFANQSWPSSTNRNYNLREK